MGILANIHFWKSRALQVLAIALFCIGAYIPAFDNGFISDDFVNLELARQLEGDIWYLFQFPPLNFRLTSFLSYGVLWNAAGSRSEVYYAANLLIHFLNCLLLWKLLMLLGRDRKEAYLAALLFAVLQSPQEAIMWIAAMNETLLALFVLITLVLWFKGRYLISACAYFIALFSKESAPLVLALVLLIHWYRRERIFSVQLVLLLLPTVIFAATFLWTWGGNSMIQHDVYHFGFQGIPVLLRSLHLLFRPSFYALLVLLIGARIWSPLAALPKYIFWITVPMLPYAFLTYSRYIPSRQVYMASMVLVALMAYLICRLPKTNLQMGFIAAFLIYNVGYTWIRNDPEFERRAAPTTQLLTQLQRHPPRPILLLDFPYPVTDIAKLVSRLAPGWTPDLIRVNESVTSCPDCVVLRWDTETQRYTGVW